MTTDEGGVVSKKSDEYIAGLSEEDKSTLIQALKTWEDSGERKPRIPIGEDIDGDGLIDSWALDREGNLMVVPTTLRGSVFVADGEGEEYPS